MAKFTRCTGSPFWALDPPPAACVVGYLPFDHDDPPGQTVTLAESWQRYPGCYLVTAAGTALDGALADALTGFLAGRAPRVAWVANPQDPPARWRTSWLASDGSVLTGLARLTAGSLDLWLGAGCAIAPSQDGDALTVSPGSIYLTSGFGTHTLAVDTAVTLPFDVQRAGCAQAGLTLDNTRADGAFAALDVGLRIFGTDRSTPWLPDRLTSWRYPVFTPVQHGAAAHLGATLSLHPLLPLDPARTGLGLVPSGQSAGPELSSCYVTTNGLPVRLTPLAPADAPARAGRLVLAVRALSDGPSAADPCYFVPSGAFRITVVDAQGAPVGGDQRLLCGLSGIEDVVVGPDSELWFSPGGAALVAGKGLRASATTAYASVFGPGGTAGRVYRAQADDAALFAPAGVGDFLSFHELGGVTLPAAGDGGGLPAGYPLLPYTGVAAVDLDPYRARELQPVATTRRALIGSLGTKRPAADTATTTTATITPQGLLADVDAAGTVVNLTLARSPSGAVLLGGVSADLAAALQSSQLFLVASDPSTLCTTQPTDAGVSIPGPTGDPSDSWTIDVWPGTPWSATGTLLVLKFAGV
ncbi:MAG: hypothetical protein HOY78_42825, partial [Saccharothrix sp.]|nr:hypothetical protein [Saccharothrix sp.]